MHNVDGLGFPARKQEQERSADHRIHRNGSVHATSARLLKGRERDLTLPTARGGIDGECELLALSPCVLKCRDTKSPIFGDAENKAD